MAADDDFLFDDEEEPPTLKKQMTGDDVFGATPERVTQSLSAAARRQAKGFVKNNEDVQDRVYRDNLEDEIRHAQTVPITKAKKRRKKHLRAMSRGYEVTPAQRLMRAEMAEPKPLGAVIDEVMHPNSDVTSVALDIIEAGPNLHLSFQQWKVVQGLIEAGIHRGYDLGLAACR